MAVTPITLDSLTQATLEGTGIFDTLMRANKAHLEAEFAKNRIKGPEYATVYLGALEAVMQTALQFALQRQRSELDAQLVEKQILLTQAQIDKVTAEIALVNQQKENLAAEALNLPKQGALLDAQKASVEKEALRTVQQTANLAAEAANVPKQGALLDAQTAVQSQQVTNLAAEKLRIDAQSAQLTAETLNIPKQGALIDAQKEVQLQQKLNLVSEELGIDARTALTTQQTANAVTENTVLVAQECKLRAEYDVLLQNKLKAVQETSLLAQKILTEKAQTTALGVDADSVVGKQKALYAAQTEGFARDAEQKAAELLTRTWMTRRTTDEATVADGVNMLNDAAIGRAITKLLAGVNA